LLVTAIINYIGIAYFIRFFMFKKC